MERNIDNELLEMWNKAVNIVESTIRTKARRVAREEIAPLEEEVKRQGGVLDALARGVLQAASLLKKK